MKNKKIYLFIVTMVLIAIMLFANSTNVYASNGVSFESGTSNTTFYVYTAIERWTPANDLVFTKNDEWSGSWYTKSVYLRDTNDSNYTNSVEITESMIDTDTHEVSLNGINNSNFNIFTYGSTVYLVEEYNISSLTSEASYSNFTIDQENTDYSLPCEDRLSLGIDTSNSMERTIVNTSMSQYTSPNSSCQLYIQSKYQNSSITESNRDIYIYPFMKNSLSEKVTKLSQGTIKLPIFNVDVNSLSAYGNAMHAGGFQLDLSNFGDSTFISEHNSPTGVSSSYGYYSGHIIQNDNYSLLSYSDLNSLSNSVNATYSWSSQDVATNSSDSISFSADLGSIGTDSTTTNSYKRTISGSISRETSAPNGVFYNVLPFVIAGIVAILGIVILKKNSVK